MGEAGLEEVADPSGLFLVRREGGAARRARPWPPSTRAPGSSSWRSRPSTVPAKAGLTRVYSERIDSGRVARIAAVLEKHTGLRFSDQDIYVNVAGGMRLTEPGIDLALAAALYSARSGLALPAGSALAGELSLAGEVRPVRQMRRRAGRPGPSASTSCSDPAARRGRARNGRSWATSAGPSRPSLASAGARRLRPGRDAAAAAAESAACPRRSGARGQGQADRTRKRGPPRLPRPCGLYSYKPHSRQQHQEQA